MIRTMYLEAGDEHDRRSAELRGQLRDRRQAERVVEQAGGEDDAQPRRIPSISSYGRGQGADRTAARTPRRDPRRCRSRRGTAWRACATDPRAAPETKRCADRRPNDEPRARRPETGYERVNAVALMRAEVKRRAIRADVWYAGGLAGALALMRQLSVYSDLFSYRELFANLFRRDLQKRYKGSVLGVVWVLLPPLILLGDLLPRVQRALGCRLGHRELLALPARRASRPGSSSRRRCRSARARCSTTPS